MTVTTSSTICPGVSRFSLQELFGIEAVCELLPGPAVEHLHLRRAVEACDLLAETAVQHAVFQRHHQPVIGFQFRQQRFVDAGNVARIDQRGFDSRPLFQQLRNLLAEP